MTRKMYFEDSLANTKKLNAAPVPETITRDSLEEEARQGSLKSSRVEEKFWARQRNWRETAMVGSQLIQQAAPEEPKKTK